MIIFLSFMRQTFQITGLERGTLLVHMGRDHGLPGYEHWLQKCNHNLTQPLPSSIEKLLHRIYMYVHIMWSNFLVVEDD
jgi:hypothetical protein